MKRRTFLTTVTGIAASTAFPQFAIGKLNVAFIGSGGCRVISKTPST
jgi:hypothetical protein